MPLHVIPADNAARQATACDALKAQGLDAILMFAPESRSVLVKPDGL